MAFNICVGWRSTIAINWPELRKCGQHYEIISAETLKRNNFETCGRVHAGLGLLERAKLNLSDGSYVELIY
jgi:hypothetical protein